MLKNKMITKPGNDRVMVFRKLNFFLLQLNKENLIYFKVVSATIPYDPDTSLKFFSKPF